MAVTLIIGKLVPSLPSAVPPMALATGFGVSVAIGIFFGTWPAVKAARLDPVEALRYEKGTDDRFPEFDLFRSA